MGKLLRVIVFVLGGLLLLVVAAAIILPLVVDPNDFKDEISQAVESKTGRVLAIEGDIGLSVFPWLGLEIGPTSLSNAPGFSAAPFAGYGRGTGAHQAVTPAAQRAGDGHGGFKRSSGVSGD